MGVSIFANHLRHRPGSVFLYLPSQPLARIMGGQKSAVSRLESGVYTRPTLGTIEKYALAVRSRMIH